MNIRTSPDLIWHKVADLELVTLTPHKGMTADANLFISIEKQYIISFRIASESIMAALHFPWIETD